jgi:hypothetical protein
MEASNQTRCERTYLMLGIDLTPPILNDLSKAPPTEVVLAKNQQGYLLEYTELPSSNNYTTEQCSVYGYPFASFNLCLENLDISTLQARKWKMRINDPKLTAIEIVVCPTDIAASSNCRTDTSWLSNAGWALSLRTSFQNSTVAYSRINGTILSYQITQPETKPAPVAAADMLQAYRDAFGNFTTISDILSIFSNPQDTGLFPIYTFPALVAANLNGIGIIAQENTAIEARAADTFQDVLAIMLFYSQPSLFARVLAPKVSTFEPGSELEAFASSLLSANPPTTWVSLAIQRYQIQVGKATLISYVAVMGVCLLICGCVLTMSSLSVFSEHIPELSGFPFLDVISKCTDVSIADIAGTVRSTPPKGGQRRLLRNLSENIVYVRRI